MGNFTDLQNKLNQHILDSFNIYKTNNPGVNQQTLNSELSKITQQETNKMRLSYITEYGNLVDRNVICYYSTFVQRQGSNNPELSINDNDINGLMNAVSKCDKNLGLDLILHTPGGGIAATESIVKYLRKVFGYNIKVIVPHLAMSAGTMIACSSKMIVMGKESSLGPIDPQLHGVPVQGVIDEFNKALEETVAVPNKALIWREIISKYSPTFLSECQNASELSENLVKNWLTTGMFKNRKNKDALVNNVYEVLGNHKNSKLHEKHYDYEDCRKMGLVVSKLECNQEIQDLILSIHHLYVLSAYNEPNTLKFIESNGGMSYVITGK